MSKEEASDYLKGQGISKVLALKLYELVGGRMVDLEFAAEQAKELVKIKDQNKIFEGMYCSMLRRNNVGFSPVYSHTPANDRRCP